jgi:hypothetical protein
MTPCVLPGPCWYCGELLVFNGRWCYCCGDQCSFGAERKTFDDQERNLVISIAPNRNYEVAIFHKREANA